MRVLTLALVALWTTSLGAQSLGDIARQEAERRKTVKAPGKTYTNDQLKPEPLGSAPAATPPDQAGAAPATPSPVAPGAATPGAGAGAPPAAGAASQGPKEEAAWRSRIQAAREALSRAQLFSDALQSRVNGLWADFTARDDPGQRAAVAADRQKALDEMEKVKKEIQQLTKALADIQEEGRRAGVPAGWLR